MGEVEPSKAEGCRSPEGRVPVVACPPVPISRPVGGIMREVESSKAEGCRSPESPTRRALVDKPPVPPLCDPGKRARFQSGHEGHLTEPVEKWGVPTKVWVRFVMAPQNSPLAPARSFAPR